MCEICGQIPCHPSCPNADEELPVERCVECGEGIYSGEKYFASCIGPICQICMEDKTVDEILESMGEKMTVAEVA